MTRQTVKPAAILIHLANTRHLTEFKIALSRINSPKQLFVNLVASLNTPEEVERQYVEVRNCWPQAAIQVSANRGMDVGGMLRLLNVVDEGSCSGILYLHSKSDDRWRRSMLEPVTRCSDQVINLFNGSGSGGKRIGMAGAWLYPFDYFNVDPYLDILNLLGTPANTTWHRYSERFPKTAALPVPQRISHALDYGHPELRPEVDLDFIRHRFGDIPAGVQFMRNNYIAEFRAWGLLGPLPYFPGNFFWICSDLVTRLKSQVNFEAEFEKLKKGPGADSERQSRAHAWERALPAFAQKSGFELVRLTNPD